jgi:uncharacterized protein (TIGR00299 family) protein
MGKFLFIECDHTGISGDLLLCSLGSLVGLEKLKSYLERVLKVNSCVQQFELNFETMLSHGISGIHLDLDLNEDVDLHHSIDTIKKDAHIPHENHQIPPSYEHQHAHGHDHEHKHDMTPAPHQHSHGSYAIAAMKDDFSKGLSQYSFPQTAISLAHQILENIILTESEIHQIPPDQVHLHEIGAVDTIIDILGTVFCLQELGVFLQENPTFLYFSSIAVGGGSVKIAHGTVPVPAPATLLLLSKNKLSWKYGPEDRELATPTGVAILSALITNGIAKQQRPIGSNSTNGIGIGVGSLKLSNTPNILRIQFGESFENGVNSLKSYPIYVLETNIDDVRGEILGNLVGVLGQKGALDVSLIPCTGKKNRPGILIKVICNKDKVESLSQCLIAETGTLGVRINEETRYCLNRKMFEKEITINDQKFIIHIKQALNSNNEIIQQKVEFDDLKRIAETLQLPIRIVENKIAKDISFS